MAPNVKRGAAQRKGVVFGAPTPECAETGAGATTEAALLQDVPPQRSGCQWSSQPFVVDVMDLLYFKLVRRGTGWRRRVSVKTVP